MFISSFLKYSMTTLRSRKIGSNATSDKYRIPVSIECRFCDLALFIAHTGFVNIRHAQRKSDQDVIPIFDSLHEVCKFRPNRYGIETDSTCGYTFTSLEVAWRIVAQQTMDNGNDLWYIIEDRRFILYIKTKLSVGTVQILADEEEDPSFASPFYTTFRSERSIISIDSFLLKHIRRSVRNVTSRNLFNSLMLMFPRHLLYHRLTQAHITNRVAKLTLDISIGGLYGHVRES